MALSCKIGVDGGGSKTECILVDAAGEIVARHLAPGCNPSVVGAVQAGLIVTDALKALTSNLPAAPQAESESPVIDATLLCMAGSRAFWQAFAASLAGFGRVTALDDSQPVLELATGGQLGLVLHAGTGSFVAARAPDGSHHYAGGLGWRFGDPGSGYDISRRAIARGLLEIQGWVEPSRVGPAVRAHGRLGDSADASSLARHFHQHPDASPTIASLAPAILRLAGEGDPNAEAIVIGSATELLDLAAHVAARLFPGRPLETIPAGLSGPILTHPVVQRALTSRGPFTLAPVEGTPIDGVRRLLSRL